MARPGRERESESEREQHLRENRALMKQSAQQTVMCTAFSFLDKKTESARVKFADSPNYPKQE